MIRTKPRIQTALKGVNAAVVGILLHSYIILSLRVQCMIRLILSLC